MLFWNSPWLNRIDVSAVCACALVCVSACVRACVRAGARVRVSSCDGMKLRRICCFVACPANCDICDINGPNTCFFFLSLNSLFGASYIYTK